MLNHTDDIRQILLDRDQFTEIAHMFVRKAAKELELDNARWAQYFEGVMEAISEDYINCVFKKSQSPIERKFLNSLLLSAIKTGDLGLIMHRTYGDAESEISEFRETIKGFREFWIWFQKNKKEIKFDDFLEIEVARGALPKSEVPIMKHLALRYGYVPLMESIHITVQPNFSEIKVDGKSARPDIYFWIPSKPNVNVIVECDGFQFHSSKSSFINDRKRDRILKNKGYDVLRFSGTEIFNDPIHIPFEIFSFLKKKREESSTEKYAGDGQR